MKIERKRYRKADVNKVPYSQSSMATVIGVEINLHLLSPVIVEYLVIQICFTRWIVRFHEEIEPLLIITIMFQVHAFDGYSLSICG